VCTADVLYVYCRRVFECADALANYTKCACYRRLVDRSIVQPVPWRPSLMHVIVLFIGLCSSAYCSIYSLRFNTIQTFPFVLYPDPNNCNHSTRRLGLYIRIPHERERFCLQNISDEQSSIVPLFFLHFRSRSSCNTRPLGCIDPSSICEFGSRLHRYIRAY